METTEQPAWGKRIERCFILPQRVILATMACFSVIVLYILRVIINTAITKLVVRPHSNVTVAGACPMEDSGKDEVNETKQYDWDEDLQGQILGSFYIGHVITHLPSGILAQKYGPKWLLAGAILINAALSLLTPLTIKKGGPNALIINRVIMGGGQGAMFPCLSVLIAAWIPKQERTILGAFIMGGAQIGTVLANSFSGLILTYYSWEVPFYIFSIIAIIFFVLFILLVYNSPFEHPFIKEYEVTYLRENLTNRVDRHLLPPIPWKSIFTSVPVYALLFVQMGFDWGFYTILTDLPKYFNDVLNIDIHDTGLLISLPFFLMWIFSIIVGYIADLIINNEKLSRTTCRRIYAFIASIPTGALIVCVSYGGCNVYLVMFFFIMALSVMSFYYASVRINANDLCPNYAGMVMAIVNGAGAITGFVSPVVVGALTKEPSLHAWRKIFWITFSIKAISSMLFYFAGSGDVQPWNDAKTE